MTVVEEPDPMAYVNVALVTLVVMASATELTPVPIGTELTGRGETTIVDVAG